MTQVDQERRWSARSQARPSIAPHTLLDDPATAELTLSNRHIGQLPLDRAIDQFYTSDVFMHTWDLARATGQDDRLDPEFCALLLAGMEPLEDVMRSSGQYGPRVPVMDDADTQAKLLAFIGRDPQWTQQTNRSPDPPPIRPRPHHMTTLSDQYVRGMAH
jgi:uncharacterized protein (TIGR03086 family)